MSSAVAELEAGLQAMLSLKPPGVSGSRIQNLTALCTTNVQSESVLVQKLYTHFKKAPGTHKLGVLYVVDSVTRKWNELAKSAGQPIDSAAQDGTYAAGVHRVKELLPVLMNDISQSAPDDQKEKIRKLIDIWEKGQTFPLQMLNSFKEKLNTPSHNQSTTPPGSPPTTTIAQPLNNLQPNTSSILAALANMARQQNTAPPPANKGVQNQDSLYTMPIAQNNPAQQVAALNQSLPISSVAPLVNMPGPAATFAQHLQGANGTAQNYASNPSNPFTTAPAIAPSTATLDPAVQQQLVLIKTLSDAGVPHDQIAGIISQLGNQGGVAGGLPTTQYPSQNQIPSAQNGWSSRPDESRDHTTYPGGVRSPGPYRRRSRSPSPHRGWNARDSPSSRRRDDGYDHGRDSPGLNREDRGRGGSRNDYRQRSPPRRGHTASPPAGYGGGEKWVGHDSTIPKGHIKVLSRTLFVGGVTCTEQELRRIFERLGHVQTCIVNREKRHAFVKMVSRTDAVSAKDAMERNRGSTESQLRTRWGVGFGPRDCSDYQTGISIIPISKLTDADRKWMLNAEYGGSGGKPIESGMVVEEPDIEIGQGVSSKAISRRMQTDKGGSNGPKSTRERDDDDGPRRRRGSREEHRDGGGRKEDRHPTASAPPSMPSIPPFGIAGFPFQMPTLPNGMPMFPPGFILPGQQQSQNQTPQQPPPPGHRT